MWAIVIKLKTAIVALQAATTAAGGITAALSGGNIGLIIAGIAGAISLITMLTGSMAKALEPVDYSEQIASLSEHQGTVSEMAKEYTGLAAKEKVTATESARMNEILKTLAGTSQTLHDALTTATGGFVNQAEAVKTLNGYLADTGEKLNNLERLQATEAFKDLGSLKDAQKAVKEAKAVEDTLKEFDIWRKANEGVGSENFIYYANRQAADPKADTEKWGGIADVVHEMQREIFNAWTGYNSEDVDRWFMKHNLSVRGGVESTAATLDGAWEEIEKHLLPFARGPQYDEMGGYWQGQMDQIFKGIVDSIDKEGKVTEEAILAVAVRIDAGMEELFKVFSGNPDLAKLMEKQEEMLPTLKPEGLEEYNALIGEINKGIEAANALMPDDARKLDLFPTFTDDELKKLREAEAELTTLSAAMNDAFAKIRKGREAEAAEKNLYADEIKALKDAWATDESGTAFIKTLNGIFGANDALGTGLLETYEALETLANGEMDHAEGLEAFAGMERHATTLSQERTAKLLEEAEAEKAVAEGQKEHYLTMLGQLRDTYQQSGYDAFVAQWDKLSDTAKQDISDLYPEVAKLATAMGEAGDGAVILENALNAAANMDFTNFRKTFGEDSIKQKKSEDATAAKDAGFKDQLATLDAALKTGGAEAMRNALFDIMSTNEELYGSLMSTYTVLYQLADGTLNTAQAADILSQAYNAQAINSAKSTKEMRDQLALEKELVASGKGYYKDTLVKLQAAYMADGTKGFHAEWDKLDDAAKKFILENYDAVADLAVETVKRSAGVVDAIFDRAIAKAEVMKEKLLKESLAEGAAEYMTKLPADDAQETGFQDQLKALREALTSGDFMGTLAGFGEAITSALMAEHPWLNEIIAMLGEAEAGTVAVTDATLLMDEHIQGTYEHFLASIEALTEANGNALDTEEEQIATLSSLLALLNQDNGVEAFGKAFSSMDEEMRKALYDAFPALQEFFEAFDEGSEGAGAAIAGLRKEIDRLNLKKMQRDGKAWDELTGAFESAEKGGREFAKSYGAVLGKVEDLTEASGALAFIQSEEKKKASDLADAYNVLATYTGVSAEQLRSNLDPALWAIAGDSDIAAGSASFLADMLFRTAGVQFSAANWQAQLAALSASSDATTANLARLIQTMLQASGSSLYMDGNTVKVKWGSGGSYTPPSARKSGGGGGGSKDAAKTVSAVEKLLEMMRQTTEIEDHRRELARMGQDYHEATGEIQGVIHYMEKERAIVQENSATLCDYLSQLEREIEIKRREVAAMGTSAKGYADAAKELDELQKQHQDYSKELLQNQTDMESLTKAIKEQYDAIREMEIDLRNTIHDAI